MKRSYLYILTAALLAVPLVLKSFVPGQPSTHIHLKDNKVIDLSNADIDRTEVSWYGVHTTWLKSGQSIDYSTDDIQSVEFNTPLFDVPARKIVDARDSTLTIAFASDLPWFAYLQMPQSRSDRRWITLVKDSGEAGESEIVLSLEPNNTGGERSADVFIRSGGYERAVTIRQSPYNAGESTLEWSLRSDNYNSFVTGDSVILAEGAGNLAAYFDQSSVYVSELHNPYFERPRADVSVSFDANKAVIVDSFDGITQWQLVSEEKRSDVSKRQVFNVGGMTIPVVWSYEIPVQRNGVDFPYLQLHDVEVAEVSEADATQEVYQQLQDGTLTLDNITPEHDYAFHRVTVVFKQKVSAVRTTEPAEAQVYYVVSFLACKQVELVAVSYEPDVRWEEPHHNMMLSFYPIVKRYRHYSNGDVRTDVFADYGHSAFIEGGALGNKWECVVPRTEDGYSEYKMDRKRYDGSNCYEEGYMTNLGQDTLCIMSITKTLYGAEKPFELKNFEILQDGWVGDNLYDWSTYEEDRMYIGFDSCKDVPDISSEYHPKDSRPSGFYFNRFAYDWGKNAMLHPWPESNPDWSWSQYITGVSYNLYDQFMVIDGRRIDFKTLGNFTHHEECDVQKTDYGYRIVTKGFFTWLGRNFRAEVELIYKNGDEGMPFEYIE